MMNALTGSLPGPEPLIPADFDDAVPLLVVDDHPPNLDAIEVLLASSGCRIVRAHSADQALLALLEQDFAAIVLDIKMPGMSGIELADLIKTRPRSRHVPILFLTAHMFTERDILRGYGVGAVDYLTKPIHGDILRSKISVFVELYRKTHELARANEALRREAVERQRIEETLRIVNLELETRVQERTQALERANRRKDEFLAVLGHELRNPLAPILSAVEAMHTTTEAPEESQVKARGVVRRQVRQMARLIDDLLDVGRITSDRLVLQLGHIDLSAVISAAVETSRPAIDERRHELIVDTPANAPVLHADAARMSQVLSNLLTNAAKYTPPGGRIAIAAEVAADGVTVRVRDNGVGIDASALPTIFELFGRVEHADQGGGGLGIGLALARQLVHMHGGRLDAKSDGPGLGSEFTVWLPPTIVATTNLGGAPERPEPADQPLRVLVVDDNVDAADMLTIMLKGFGYQTRAAYDAAAAYETAEAFRPDVALLDLGFPGEDGYAIARRLRTFPWADRLVLFAVTGRGQEEDRQRSYAAGFEHHLVKPVSMDTLRPILARIRPVSDTRPRSPQGREPRS